MNRLVEDVTCSSGTSSGGASKQPCGVHPRVVYSVSDQRPRGLGRMTSARDMNEGRMSFLMVDMQMQRGKKNMVTK